MPNSNVVADSSDSARMERDRFRPRLVFEDVLDQESQESDDWIRQRDEYRQDSTDKQLLPTDGEQMAMSEIWCESVIVLIPIASSMHLAIDALHVSLLHFPEIPIFDLARDGRSSFSTHFWRQYVVRPLSQYRRSSADKPRNVLNCTIHDIGRKFRMPGILLLVEVRIP